MYQLITAPEAVRMIRDGDTVAFNGQNRIGVPELFFHALAELYEKTGHPKGIRYLATSSFPVTNVLAGHKGLLKEVMLAHWQQLMPKFAEELWNNEFEAYALPQGYLAINYDVVARKAPGYISKIGLHTSVDPRYGTCGINSISTKHFTTPMEIDGEEYLFYKAIVPRICVIRGTTADVEGNITMEHEGGTADAMAMAMAAHNNDGIVIVQVERLSDGHADPHAVKVPGCLVDYIYLDPDQVMMHDAVYDPIYSGEKRLEGQELTDYLNRLYDITVGGRTPTELVIAKRAAMELGKGYIVNLGVGMPAMIPYMPQKLDMEDPEATFTIECGTMGGYPCGYYFGLNANVSAIIPQSCMFHLYEGKGLDMTGVGALEIDRHGNVNVIRKGRTFIGIGGFNHVTTGARKLVVMSRFMLGSSIDKVDGKLVCTDGRADKFCEKVENIDFAADMALAAGQEVLYITERCVFRLTDQGLTLAEVAPGLDLEADILSKLPFRPAISPDLKEMPLKCFEA